jgi:hypothetical protein
MMARYIRQSIDDPVIQAIAGDIREQAAKTKEPELACAWWWVKYHVHFVHHDKQICQMTGECNTSNYQMLVEPRALVRLRSMEGDCAVFTMLIDTLACALGYPVRIATIEADRRRPGEYSHVYGEAFLAGPQLWCPLDASHGTGPGWEVPARDIARKTEWDLDGNILADQRAPKPQRPANTVRDRQIPQEARSPASPGMAGAPEGEAMPYVRRTHRMSPGGAQLQGGWPTRRTVRPGGAIDVSTTVRGEPIHPIQSYVESVRGMGQDDGSIDFTPIDTSIPTGVDFPVDATPISSETFGTLPPSPVTLPTSTMIPTPTSSTPSSWATFLNSLTGGAATGVKIAQQLQGPSLVPGTNVLFNPVTGQYYNPATGQVVNAPGLPGSTSALGTSLMSSPLLLLGGLGLGVVLLMALAKR